MQLYNCISGKSTATIQNERTKVEEMLISLLETVLTEMPGT